ncbi:hypothetical protein BGV68_01910 [Burkholderia ubonensis]|nr:hypothetical protein BGV68_01910 [Burkholderia ubonensis]
MRVVGGDRSTNLSSYGSTVSSDSHNTTYSTTNNIATDFGSVAGGLSVAAQSVAALRAGNADAVGAVAAISAQSMGFASDALHQTTLAFSQAEGLTADVTKGALSGQQHAYDSAETQISGAYSDAIAQLKDAYETTHASDQKSLSTVGMLLVGVVSVAAIAFTLKGRA